jgi:hypothetical protein
MKPKTNFRKASLILLIFTISLMGCSSLKNKKLKSTNLNHFKLIVEKTNEGIKMQSIEGSAWINLAFSINNYQPQAIDEYGMTELNKISSVKDSNLADFLFTVTKTENGIVLKGIKGMAWTDLSFSLSENGKQAIDQFGMTKLN